MRFFAAQTPLTAFAAEAYPDATCAPLRSEDVFGSATPATALFKSSMMARTSWRHDPHRVFHVPEKALSVAETDSARERIDSLLDQIEKEQQQEDDVVASMEVARLSRDELGSRLVPLAGAYLKTPSRVRSSLTPR